MLNSGLLSNLHLALLGSYRTYSICLFSLKNSVAFLVLFSTFIYPVEGLLTFAGIFCINFIAIIVGLEKEKIIGGIYTVSALFLFLSLFSVYDISWQLLVLMAVGGIFSVLVTILINALLNRVFLPALSLPFIISYWIIFLSASQFKTLDLSSDSIYYLSSIIGFGDMHLLSFYRWLAALSMPNVIREYLVALGAIFLQFNIVSGLIIAIALFIQSRITLLLSIIGFTSGYYYYVWLIGDISQISYGYIGYNFILVSIALGGFFLVPTRAVFGLTLLVVPITALLSSALYGAFYSTGLPIFSLPYILTAFLILYGVTQTYRSGWLIPVDLFVYSPENTLYNYQAEKQNTLSSKYVSLGLPFFGTWKVTQDDKGGVTHKGEWRYAWDVVVYRNGNSWQQPGSELKHFYSYGLPVLAPADGWIVDVFDGVVDNDPNQVNIQQNWGNSIVIYHAPGLYTQLSHLMNDSIQCEIGDQVNRGQQLALLGNSGRSPEPHIHYQIQATPAIGSRTIQHPLRNYISSNGETTKFVSCGYPRTGEDISNPIVSDILTKALYWPPGKILEWTKIDDKGTETTIFWEVCTDAYNQTYIACKQTNAVAYFYNDGTSCEFKTFYGSKKSDLFLFFQMAHTIILIATEGLSFTSQLPIFYKKRNLLSYLQDFLAPFYQFQKLTYKFHMKGEDHPLAATQVSFQTSRTSKTMGKETSTTNAQFTISNDKISRLEITKKNKTLTFKQNH